VNLSDSKGQLIKVSKVMETKINYKCLNWSQSFLLSIWMLFFSQGLSLSKYTKFLRRMTKQITKNRVKGFPDTYFARLCRVFLQACLADSSDLALFLINKSKRKLKFVNLLGLLNYHKECWDLTNHPRQISLLGFLKRHSTVSEILDRISSIFFSFIEGQFVNLTSDPGPGWPGMGFYFRYEWNSN